MKNNIKRGEIYIAQLDPTLGSEQGKQRRVLIVSNDIGNAVSPVIIAVPITSIVTDRSKKMPQNVHLVPTEDNGQTEEALIDCNQLRALDVSKRLGNRMGKVNDDVINKVNASLETCLQLKTCPQCNRVLLPNRNHCVSCKHVLVRICQQCHTKINNEYRYCPHCSAQRGDVNE